MGASDLRYNGRCTSLLRLRCSLRVPARATSVKWISLSARPPRTDRRFSERMNRYLSSRCLIGRDYTLPGKGVKQPEFRIIKQTLEER